MSEKPRVIVIDDNQTNLDVFCEFLNLQDVNVVGRGNNGLDAVNLFERHNPDVVLMDLAMPNYDGYYGLDNILRLNKNAKVIMITAVNYNKLSGKLFERGAAKVLYKPFELNKIVEMINEMIKQENTIST